MSAAKLVVKNIPPGHSPATVVTAIQQVFGEFGARTVNVLQQFPGYAVVIFDSEQAALHALSQVSFFLLYGAPVSVFVFRKEELVGTVGNEVVDGKGKEPVGEGVTKNEDDGKGGREEHTPAASRGQRKRLRATESPNSDSSPSYGYRHRKAPKSANVVVSDENIFEAGIVDADSVGADVDEVMVALEAAMNLVMITTNEAEDFPLASKQVQHPEEIAQAYPTIILIEPQESASSSKQVHSAQEIARESTPAEADPRPCRKKTVSFLSPLATAFETSFVSPLTTPNESPLTTPNESPLTTPNESPKNESNDAQPPASDTKFIKYTFPVDQIFRLPNSKVTYRRYVVPDKPAVLDKVIDKHAPDVNVDDYWTCLVMRPREPEDLKRAMEKYYADEQKRLDDMYIEKIRQENTAKWAKAVRDMMIQDHFDAAKKRLPRPDPFTAETTKDIRKHHANVCHLCSKMREWHEKPMPSHWDME